MAQALGQENLDSLVKIGLTALILPAGSTVNVGGQQNTNSTNLQVNLSTNGSGGLDTGTIASNTNYFIYEVL